MACATPFHEKKILLKIYDGTAVTPQTLDLSGFITSWPEWYNPTVRNEAVEYNSQGEYYGSFEGQTNPPDKPELTLSGDIVGADIASKKVKILELAEEKSYSGTPAVNTNTDGSTTYLDEDGADYSSCIPTSKFCQGIAWVAQNGTTAEDNGRNYSLMEIVNATATINNNILSYTLTFVLHSKYSAIDKTDFDAIGA